MSFLILSYILFFFNDTATTEIYTLSLHDALPICRRVGQRRHAAAGERAQVVERDYDGKHARERSEEHTSELQSRRELVCRLLLEKKKQPLILPLHIPYHPY